MDEDEIVELPNEPTEDDWDELPFKVGDVICRHGALRSPAKIMGIKRTTKYNVTLYVVTAKKRFCEWQGSIWYFEKPEARASYFLGISNHYKERANDILERAEAARMVTP